MIPEIGLLTVTQIDWPTFRATMDKVLKLRPDEGINRLPVNLSDDAKILLNIAAYYGWKMNNPLDVLRRLPPIFMEYLSYSFFIACNNKVWEEFNPNSNLNIIRRELPECLLLITSGTLSIWYSTIVTNLERDWEYSHETRILFCKLMIAFEKRGLNFLFENYKKKVQKDYTWLLEKK